MKHMKKMFTLMLAVIMTLAMSVTAFADGEEAKAVINFPTDAKFADHTYQVYQIFTGKVDRTAMTNLKYGENTKTAANKGKAVTPEDLKTLAGIESENDQEKLAAILPFADLTTTPVATLTKTNTTYEGAPGYYLIKDADNSQTGVVEKDKDKSYTLYILAVAGTVNITPKADTPSVEKKVDDVNDSTGTKEAKQDSADYDIGDWVPYHLTATTASNVDKYKKYHLTFVDTLEAGRFDGIQNIVIKVDGTPITDSFEGFTVTRTDVTAPSATGFEIKLAFAPKAAEGQDAPTTLPDTLNGKEVTIDFEAQLGAGAKIGQEGNVNTVQLKFSNNPNSEDDSEEAETPEDTVIVFTYKTVIDKIDADGNALKGAAFKLYKKYTAAQLAAAGKTAAEVKDAEGNPIAKYANTDEASYVEIATVDAITADTTSFAFNGLDDGDYVLVETKKPANYNAIDPIEFTVTGTHTALADGLDKTTKKDGDAYVLTGLTVSNDKLTASLEGGEIAKTNGEKHAAVSGEIYGEVINQSGAELPETGGVGTTMFYIIGSILVISAGVVLVTRRRMAA